MIAVTAASAGRWAVKRRPMRRRDTWRACVFSAALTVRWPRSRPDGGGFQGALPFVGDIAEVTSP